MSDQTPVNSIKRAFDILESITERGIAGKGFTLTELAEVIGVKAPTARNILKTMEICGYLARNSENLYCLGPMCENLARGSIISGKLSTAAVGPMEILAHETGESLVLATICNRKWHSIMQVQGASVISVNSSSLKGQSFYSLATARVMLAFITANERKLLLSEYGAPTSEDWAEAATNGLENELEKIKNNGYCENASGQNVRSLAVPIIENDILLGSLGMYLPAFRFDESNKNGVLENMKATVENILSRIQSL